MFTLGVSFDDAAMQGLPKVAELAEFLGLKLTLPELRYVYFKKCIGLTQAEAQEIMELSQQDFQRIRRNADLKIAARSTYNQPRPRNWFAGMLPSPANEVRIPTVPARSASEGKMP